MKMHMTRKTGPSGRIDLYYENDESDFNSQAETIRWAELGTERDAIVLTLNDSHFESTRPSIDTSKSRYSIDVDVLIDLIKANGKALPAVAAVKAKKLFTWQ
jgi:hypothetical protein